VPCFFHDARCWTVLFNLLCLFAVGNDAGFDTTATADVHTVPAHVVHRSYGAISDLASPSATVFSEIVADNSEQERDESIVVAADHHPLVGDTSIQHSSNDVLV